MVVNLATHMRGTDKSELHLVYHFLKDDLTSRLLQREKSHGEAVISQDPKHYLPQRQ